MSDCGMSTGADAGGGPGHAEDRGHVLDSGYNDQDQHGYSDHDREMTYDSREQKYLGETKIYLFIYYHVGITGEGSDREMGFINSEPSLQEFMPHQLDDNTPPPTGTTTEI